MKHRLRIEIFFDAGDDVGAREFAKWVLSKCDIHADKVAVHRLDRRSNQGHHVVNGPWQGTKDAKGHES